MKFLTLALSIGSLLVLTGGCAAGPHTTAGATVGTGLGALTGAIIGHQSGHAAGGAIIGAASGALAGGLIGNAEDARNERDVAIAHAQYERAAYQAQARAMHNSDLVMMSQSGVSDEVIISSVHSRGGQFDLSPAAIIQLKNSGVSDRVILAMQSSSATAPPLYVPPTQAYYPATYPYPAYTPAPVTEVIVVPARPRVGFGVVVGPRRYCRPHYHHRHHW